MEKRLLRDEEPRNPEYWEKLRDHLEAQVHKFSSDMETMFKWSGPYPWFRFTFIWNEDLIRARIRRTGLQAEIIFSLGLLRWLDSVAYWINKDGTFRSKLTVFEVRPHEDLSMWMIHRWTDWIFRHEIGHFFCGHLSRVADTLTEGEPRISESIELTRAMEFDADMCAAFLYFAFLNQCFEKNIYQDFYGTPDVRAVFWDLGMLFGAFFTAFEELTPHGEVKTHPSAAVRWHTFFIEGMGTYSRVTGKPAPKEGNCLLNGMVNTLLRLEQVQKGFGPTLLSEKIDIGGFRQQLLDARIGESRLFKNPNDWLYRKPIET